VRFRPYVLWYILLRILFPIQSFQECKQDFYTLYTSNIGAITQLFLLNKIRNKDILSKNNNKQLSLKKLLEVVKIFWRITALEYSTALKN